MALEMRTFLPDINLLPAARITTAGTIRNKREVIVRSAGSFDFYALIALHAGSGFLRHGDAKSDYDLTAGDFFVLAPDNDHAYGPQENSNWDESYLTFSGVLFDTLLSSGVIPTADPVIPAVPEAYHERMLSLVRLAEGPVGTPPSVFLGLIVGLLCELGGSLAPRHVSLQDRAWIDEVYRCFAMDQPASRSIGDVARELGTSYGSFVKRFTRLTGKPPGRVWTQLVMEQAAALLRDDARSITQIADALGFSDPAYFCRRFREQTGYSPGQFRRLSLGR
jgi:AraC-like DNA-binding protein